jgi:uncharacterized CHY-type Zn-finger protein
MAAKLKKSERDEMKEWQDASVTDLAKTEKKMRVRKEDEFHKPMLICHYCNNVICELEYAPATVRCPGCDKVIRHLGQKC